MMLSTRRIISAASAALSNTCRFTWKLSVMPRSAMSPTQPWVMSETARVKGQSRLGAGYPHISCVCVCVSLTQAESDLVVLVGGSQLGHQLCAVISCVISDDGGQLQQHTALKLQSRH